MQKYSFYILSFLVSSYGYSQTIQEEGAATIVHATMAQFTGKVTDIKTGEALQGASVYFADIKAGATSDKEGIFVINNITTGRHLVEVSYVGYTTIIEYIDIKSDLTRNFELSTAILENNEVVVTGVSSATQQRRTATPVTVIKRQDLIKIPATNLIDGLSRKPGISQISTGPAISKPIIRGLGYNRVVVMNDGVRQEGQQWGDEHGIEIDEYSVQKVEILKGPASLMYGSDAMAGVINILTNVPVAQGTFKGSVLGNFQTNNKLRGAGLNLAANYNSGFNWNAYGTYKAASDYQNKYDGNVYNSKFNERNFGGYIGYNGNWGYSHMLLSSFNQKIGVIEGDRNTDGAFIKPLPGGGEAIPSDGDFNTTVPQIPWQQIKHFKVVSDNSFNLGSGRVSMSVGYQKNQRIEYGNVDDPTEKGLYFDLHTITYSVSYHFQERKQWRNSIGINGMIQNNRNKGAEVLIPEYNLGDIGGFYYSQKNWDKITFSGGFRFDLRRLDSKPLVQGSNLKFVAFNKNFSNLSGSAGISYLASKQITVKLNVARGFRAPAIAELASNGTHEGTNRYEYGDRNLKSETSLQLDGSIEWATQHLSFGASLFYNIINDFIFYRKLANVAGGDSMVTVDGKEIQAFKFDQQNATLVGAEFSLDIHPHPLDWLHVENSFSFVRGKFKNGIEGSSNIPFIPAARLVSNIRADVFAKGKTIRSAFVMLELEKTFSQDHPFTAYATETATGSYTLLNAGFGADVVNKSKTLFSVYVNVINLADIAYQNHLSRLKYAPENMATGRTGVFGAGRNFSIKLNVPFGSKINTQK